MENMHTDVRMERVKVFYVLLIMICGNGNTKLCLCDKNLPFM